MLRADEPGGPVLRPVPGMGAEKTGHHPEATDRQSPGDDRLGARIARADRYFNEHLRHQRDWYSEKASRCKAHSQQLSLTVILAGTLTIFIQILHAFPSWTLSTVWSTAAFGVVVAVAEVTKLIGKFEERGNGYRRASEKMKREYRLYINNVEPYFLMPDEDEAYRIFVTNIESIIAEEQQLGSPSDTS